jgi:hypothetical protein
MYSTDCLLPLLYCMYQREGMGLLEYQAMPSLRDVAHDGVLCTISNRSAPPTGASGVRQGKRHGPSITYKAPTLLGHSPPASQAGRRVGAAL